MQNQVYSKTTFVNPEVVRLEKELRLLTQQQRALEVTRSDLALNTTRSDATLEVKESDSTLDTMMINSPLDTKGYSTNIHSFRDNVAKRSEEMSPLDDKNSTNQTRKKMQQPVCTHFCKFGRCIRAPCNNLHDKNLVRICPSFLKVESNRKSEV